MATFSNEEKTNLLFKKLMGKPSTLDSNKFFQEPSRPSRPTIIASSQIWSKDLPVTAPSDLQALDETSTDDNGNSIVGSFMGRTSSECSYIKRYIKVPLSMVVGADDRSYECADPAVSHPSGYADGNYLTTSGTSGASGVSLSGSTYGRVLQDAIPFNVDAAGSYGHQLYRSNNSSVAFGAAGGDWVVDTEGGIVTFYNWSSGLSINESNAPCVSFYRYVGAKGVSNSDSEQQLFSGGVDDNGSHLDSLNAIQVDDANIASIDADNLSHCLQFGASLDGAWRIGAIGGGGDPTNTRFVIQVRNSGTWHSKIFLQQAFN